LALGFQEATAPVLVACNADVVFPPDWIKLVWRLTGMPRSPALIGPRQVSSEGMITHGPIRHEGDTDGGRDFGQPDEGQFREVMLEVPQVSGSVMFIEREAFEEVGGMENMPFLYYEDALLCRRLRDAGYWIAYSGLVTFTHDVGASPVTWDRRCEYAVAAHEQWEAECAS
jgi:GT2 family glycosyltransferase